MLLDNKLVLIVEDESLIAELLEDLLADLGCQRTLKASSVEVAIESLMIESPDFAILDVNLGGKSSLPVAEALKAKAIPFLFLSGYDASSLPGPWHTHSFLGKPFSTETLTAKIAEALEV
jgi:DNA-binding response OmpR family regulator